jgi:hypothetical protein
MRTHTALVAGMGYEAAFVRCPWLAYLLPACPGFACPQHLSLKTAPALAF